MKLLAPLLVIVGLIGSGATSAVAADRPNVLFIAVDDLRPELGCYGNRIVKTPNIDRLAARSMVFTRAYCQQAVCSPSRSSLLTGKRPDATKVWDLETHFRVALPDVVTLPQHFKANGYFCTSLSKIYHRGFEDGRSWSEPQWYPNGSSIDADPVDWTKQKKIPHDVSVEEYSPQALANRGSTDAVKRPGKKDAKRGPAFEMSPKSDDELPDGATAAEAVKRLRQLKSKPEPFFLAVGFLKPHLPFVAPKKYWDLYDPNSIPVPLTDRLPEGSPEYAGHSNSELHSYVGVPTENPIPVDFAKQLRHGYYASISYTDAQIGRLLDTLDQEGLAENTVVVLWGDHGWQLGEHGLWHKHTNFEIATRVPLIVSVPKQSSAGGKCDAPVEFVDVYPTLADVCGLQLPAGSDGASLKPYIENPTAKAQKVAISQYPRSGGKAAGGSLMGYSIRDERYRLTVWRSRKDGTIAATELYDEQKDPDETTNLAGKKKYREVVETLSQHLPPVSSAALPNMQKADNSTTTKKVATAKPNVVIFIADDLTWHDVACFGGPTVAKTPHLDQLASEGLKLTGFFSPAAVCSPTRQALLTGLYPIRSGAYPNHSEVRDGTKSLPHYLKSLGYHTARTGKTHFGPKESFPFDEVLPERSVKSTAKSSTKAKSKGEEDEDGELDFAEIEQFFGKQRQEPFFLYVATHEPHGPHNKGDASAYDAATVTVPPYLVDTPVTRRELVPYLAEVTYLDAQVGKVLRALKTTGHVDDTLFLFVSEQGSSVPHSKWSCYDPGIHVAAIARWPNQIKPGTENGALVQYVDVLPTLIDIAGGNPKQIDTGCPDADGNRGFDGRSFRNVLHGKTDQHRDFVFAQHTTRGIKHGSEAYGTRAVRDQRWKLIVNLEPEAEFRNTLSDGNLLKDWRKQGEAGNTFALEQYSRHAKRPSVELYDLQSDPWELTDLATRAESGPIVARLRAELEAWMKQQGDAGDRTEREANEHQAGKRKTKPSDSN